MCYSLKIDNNREVLCFVTYLNVGYILNIKQFEDRCAVGTCHYLRGREQDISKRKVKKTTHKI